jgi:hypothetical protein
MVKGISFYMFLAMALLLSYVAPAFAAPPPGELDQSQNLHESSQQIKDHFWVAQTFTAGNYANPESRHLVVNVELMLEGNNVPVTVQIREWDGSDMGDVLGTATIPNVKWAGFYNAGFNDVGSKITAGQQYVIVVCGSSKKCLVHGTKIGDYTGNDAYFSRNSGSKWKLLKDSNGTNLTQINDFYFKSYVAGIESYCSDGSIITVCNLFDAGKNIVHIGGYGLDKSAKYKVAYYDAAGKKVYTEVKSSDADGKINSKCDFTSLITTKYTPAHGQWHAVVYKGADKPSTKYDKIDPQIIVLQDDFTVEEAAIPEFPTVVASIVVAGMCGGIYSWMKKRKMANAG